jgi:hypothetical protein
MKKIKETLLYRRFISDTPAFFKKVQMSFGSLAGLGIGMIAIPHITPLIETIGQNLILAGAVGALVAQFACQIAPAPTK